MFEMDWRFTYGADRRKVALMVSREGHCLMDLLWRWNQGELPAELTMVISNHPAYGLDDPFDPESAIDAQAHLMSDLLRQFGGDVSLALAAYNAGPGAVEPCQCVPAIPETQAYVARILGLMGGGGEVIAPALAVRLVD